MVWKEIHPVKRGDLISMKIEGVQQYYRALRGAEDIENLTLSDLLPVQRKEKE